MNKLTLNKQNQKDLTDYCKLNNIEDVDKFFQKCFKRGYDIERYGLIGNNTEKIIEYVEKEIPIEVIKYVEKETIKEVPIEVIKEVEKIVEIIKEVPVEQKIFSTNEVIVEKIVEVPIEVEKIVEKIVQVEVIKEVEKPNEKMGMLQETLMKLRREMGDKDKTITELNNKIEQLEKLVSNTGAVYMKGSNLNQNL
jgi:hypothetical protein